LPDLSMENTQLLLHGIDKTLSDHAKEGMKVLDKASVLMARLSRVPNGTCVVDDDKFTVGEDTGEAGILATVGKKGSNDRHPFLHAFVNSVVKMTISIVLPLKGESTYDAFQRLLMTAYEERHIKQVNLQSTCSATTVTTAATGAVSPVTAVSGTTTTISTTVNGGANAINVTAIIQNNNNSNNQINTNNNNNNNNNNINNNGNDTTNNNNNKTTTTNITTHNQSIAQKDNDAYEPRHTDKKRKCTRKGEN